jgi:serine/threonine protein kinase
MNNSSDTLYCSIQDIPTNSSSNEQDGESFRNDIELNYEIIEKIGSGGFGSVLLCKHKKSNKLKAIKSILIDKSIKGILDEIHTMSKLKHYDCIVPIEQLYISRDNKRLFIVMPYFELGDLRKFIKNNNGKHLNEGQIISIIYQLGEMIHTLKKESIVHRDLKLENILVDSFSFDKIKICLTDFGLAKVSENFSQTQTKMIGTIIYMSPEMYGLSNQNNNNNNNSLNSISGGKNSNDNSNNNNDGNNDNNNNNKTIIDQRSDIWSCGIILYQLLSNDFTTNILHLLMTESKNEINEKLKQNILNFNLNFNEKIQLKLLELLFKMIQVNINERLNEDEFYFLSKQIFNEFYSI